MLFIHGGGSSHSVSQALQWTTGFSQRRAESWLRNSLPFMFTDLGVTVNADKILVDGVSAGVHLALMTVSTILVPE
jgi:hypothetical protein